MSKRARRRPRERTVSQPPPTPSDTGQAAERMLLDQIAQGALDPHLEALAQAIDARAHLIHTVDTQTALAQLCVGDEVKINNTIRPHYLRGLRGRIVEIDNERATVCLHQPIGRFTAGEIRCPPLTLERTKAGARQRPTSRSH